MITEGSKADILSKLRKEIKSLQEFDREALTQQTIGGLDFMNKSFPNSTFPVAAIHELISYAPECAAATNGFLAGILASLLKAEGICLWISTKRRVFPPALKVFGIDPDRVVFIDTVSQKEALWTIEEALKCDALSAVVGELKEVGFTESRRLQLAVERSRVTGFIHRLSPQAENTTAFATRWKISPLSSVTDDAMPGVGFASWDVRLQKVRNGKPGAWQIAWAEDGFKRIPLFIPSVSPAQKNIVKAG